MSDDAVDLQTIIDVAVESLGAEGFSPRDGAHVMVGLEVTWRVTLTRLDDAGVVDVRVGCALHSDDAAGGGPEVHAWARVPSVPGVGVTSFDWCVDAGHQMPLAQRWAEIRRCIGVVGVVARGADRLGAVARLYQSGHLHDWEINAAGIAAFEGFFPAGVPASPDSRAGVASVSGVLGPQPEGLHHRLWSSTATDPSAYRSAALRRGRPVLAGTGEVGGYVVTGGPAQLCDAWGEAARMFPRTGLWPILVDTEPDERDLHLGEPGWVGSWVQAPYQVPSDVYDAITLPDRCYDDETDPHVWCREWLHDNAGLGEWLGPGPAWELPERLMYPCGAELGCNPEALLLVACSRPSQASWLLDFGIANDGVTPGMFAGVLQDWEIRYGVVPVALGDDRTVFWRFGVPPDEVAVRHWAEELALFALDSSGQGMIDPEPANVEAVAEAALIIVDWD